MEKTVIERYNSFRILCLNNAKDALKSANLLLEQNVNHIVFHLSVFALEEVGKIFIGWCNLNFTEEWDKQKVRIPLDDHVKKLFYAIWGPTISKEIITKEQVEENQGLATVLHYKRLSTLYTSLQDELLSSEKITDEETLSLVEFTRARIKLAETEGEVDSEARPSENEIWFNQVSNDLVKRNFIFGDIGQQKLIELQSIDNWIEWLRSYYEKEEKELSAIATAEINRNVSLTNEQLVPKWKIKIKIISSSHSIRQKDINSFNKRNLDIKIVKGGDNHTLIIDFVFGNDVLISQLWHVGFIASEMFVAALNIGTNGQFYWNQLIDTEKYYESIDDLENNMKLDLRLLMGLKLNWNEKKMVLTEKELVLTEIVFRYFQTIPNNLNRNSINEYLLGLGLLAKNDMHSRFEVDIFMHFFKVFKQLILVNQENINEEAWKEVAFLQIGKLLNKRDDFDRVLGMAEKLIKDKTVAKDITLTEVIGIKQYCNSYFITLAVRKMHNDNSITLTIDDEQ